MTNEERAARKSALRKQRRLDDKASGTCTLCRKVPARPQRTLCADCAAQIYRNVKRYREHKREKQVASKLES